MDHKRKIGLFPLARVMGVGRQQQRKTRGSGTWLGGCLFYVWGGGGGNDAIVLLH